HSRAIQVDLTTVPFRQQLRRDGRPRPSSAAVNCSAKMTWFFMQSSPRPLHLVDFSIPASASSLPARPVGRPTRLGKIRQYDVRETPLLPLTLTPCHSLTTRAPSLT